MSYDESSYRRSDAARHDDSDYRATSYDATSYDSGDYRDAEPGDAGANGQRRVSQAVLDDVFDDPEHGDPGRDRMAVHAVWEMLLVVAVAVLAALLYRRDSTALRGDPLNGLLVFTAALGLLALGAGLTLRAGAVNLAIGPVAVAAGLHFAEHGDRGVAAAAVPALIAGAVGGLLVALLVVGLHVPGWAASLAAALGVVVFIEQRAAAVELQGGYDPSRHALYLFAGFAVLAIIGGLVGMIKPVRRSVGRFRPVGDPARRRGLLAGVLTGGSILLATLFAVVAGVLLAAGRGTAVEPTTGLEWTGLAVGAAMVGGTSAFGRRGGVFGTLLTVVALALFIRYSEVADLRVALFAIAASVLAGGLVVTRMVEHFGRPRSARRDDGDWDTEPSGGDSDPSSWVTQRQESWSSALPAQSTSGRGDPWESDRWGSSRR